MNEKLDTPHTRTVLLCVSALWDFYMTMSTDPWSPEQAKDACRRCCVLYASLRKEVEDEDGHEGLWRMKPKMNMFQELAVRGWTKRTL